MKRDNAMIKNYNNPPLPTEEEEQKAFFRWVEFEIASGFIPELATMFAIPNSGPGSQRGQAGKMKAMGMRAGVCDVFWPYAKGGYHGLFIEFKRRKGGRISADQAQFMERVRKNHYKAVVAYGKDEAQDMVIDYYNTGFYT